MLNSTIFCYQSMGQCAPCKLTFLGSPTEGRVERANRNTTMVMPITPSDKYNRLSAGDGHLKHTQTIIMRRSAGYRFVTWHIRICHDGRNQVHTRHTNCL